MHHINQKSINLKSLLKPYFLINFTLAMLFEHIFELLCLFGMHYGVLHTHTHSFPIRFLLLWLLCWLCACRANCFAMGFFLLFCVRADFFWRVVFDENMLAFYLAAILFGCGTIGLAPRPTKYEKSVYVCVCVCHKRQHFSNRFNANIAIIQLPQLDFFNLIRGILPPTWWLRVSFFAHCGFRPCCASPICFLERGL